ncbi:sensor histidine kinase [Flavobacterium alvei]|uniref:tetratricopeptide repeat-containing sensor histidine kinase n=1 Tax=Flavobacterium alvei TaxID=2080416 RepID=UPI0026F307C1|nr:sensor histidine kinase [Flavobacterium alvei]
MHKTFLNLFFLFFCSILVAQKDTIIIKKLMDDAYTFEKKQPEKALQLYKKVHLLSLKANYNDGAFKSLLYSGFVYNDIGKYDSAKYYFDKTIDYCKKSKNLIGEAKGYANLANTYQFKGEYPAAINNYIKSIKIFEKTKDSAIISQSYQNLSAVYTQFINRKLEFFYLKKAEQFMPKANKVQLALLYGDIGLGFIRYNDFAESFSYFKKAETIAVKENNNELWFYVTRNFGEYYRIKKEYKKAIPYYEKAFKLADFAVDIIRKNDLMYIVSGLYFKDGNYSKALELANQSLALSRKIGASEFEYKTLKRLSEIHNKLNQPQKAYDFLEKSYVLKDTFFSQNHLKETTLLQTKFETEKKDKSIAEQQVKLKKQELDLIKSQKEKQLYFIASLGLILVSLGIWYFFKQRQKLKNQEIETLKQNQEIAKLEALIDGEEKERRRIAQELHDGLNGDLSAIKYRLSTLEESGLSAIDTENLNKVIDMIDESCAQVRSISHNLMPSSILEYGLIESIREYCIKIKSSDNFKIDFQIFGSYIALSKKNETVIYRIIQELVTNILKHSKATEAMIQFNYRKDELFITVEDNGIGFDKNAVSKGIGHQNIQTRIDFLNANLDVNTSADGTSYTISIDLNKVK